MSKRPGRPPLDTTDRSVAVNFRIPPKQYDALYARAKAARVTVSEYVRSRVEFRNTKIGELPRRS